MVFEGGANRTVFSCGVMDKFLEEDIMPDYYIGVSAGMMDAFLKEGLMPDYLIGVSAGIAYGVSYLSGQKGRNIEVVEIISRTSGIWACGIFLTGTRKRISIRSSCLRKCRMN